MSNRMSPQEFQNYLGLLSRLLRLRAAQREAIQDELRAHMEERFAALTSEGIQPDRAISMALAEFGDAAALAAEFSAISRQKKRRWMMRFTLGSIAASAMAVAVVTALWPDSSGELTGGVARAQQAEKSPPPETAKPDPNAQTQAKLEAIAQAEFNETSLQDVLGYLAETAGVQIHVDRRGLADAGVDPAVPVTIRLKDVPVEMLLRLTLREHGLAYMLDHGVVIVTNPDEVAASLEIRVYRVSDLVRGPEEPEAAAPADEEAAPPTAPPGPSYAPRYGPGAYGPGYAARFAPTGGVLYDDLTDLMELIRSTVQPDSWVDNGGQATIQQYRGALVISQTGQGHRQVEQLLRGLREAIGK